MNELAVSVGVILFPGLIASILCEQVTVHSMRWGFFNYGLYAFVFGVFSYLLLQGMSFTWTWACVLLRMPRVASPILDVWSIATTQRASIDLLEVLGATGLSPVVAGIAAWAINRKLVNKAAQRLRISQKFGDENLYSFFLNAQGVDWIYVRDRAANLTYQGRITAFSETPAMQELVMSEVTVFEYETSAKLYAVPVTYLARPIGSFVIEAIPSELLEVVNGEEADQ